MPPRLWQRQPGEAPADFMAFVAYLRLKGRRSHRPVATQTGRSLRAIGRLSAQFNWPGRVAAFETRLADATQDALDFVLRRQPAAAQTNLEQLRRKEFLLADQVIQASHCWLKLANDPRRRNISLNQICRLTELAFKLKCFAVGMPWIDQPRRRRKEDLPGYWTGPSAEEALKKIYGSPSSADSPPTDTVDRPPVQTSTANPPAAAGNLNSEPCDSGSANSNPPPATAGTAPVAAPQGRRRDAWSAWARSQRRAVTGRQT